MSAKSYDEVLFFVGYLRTMGLETSGIIRMIERHRGNRLSQLEVTNYVAEFQRRYPPHTRAWLARWALTMSLQFYRAAEKQVAGQTRIQTGRDMRTALSYELNRQYRDYIYHLRIADAVGATISLAEVESALGARCYRSFTPHHPEFLIWQWADYGPDAFTMADLNAYVAGRFPATGVQKLANFRAFLVSTLPEGHPDTRNLKLPLYEQVVCYLRWLTKFNPVDELGTA